MLDNLEPAPKLQAPQNFRPGIEFDGLEGTATTPGLTSEPENFDDFLRSAGIDPTDIESSHLSELLAGNSVRAAIG